MRGHRVVLRGEGGKGQDIKGEKEHWHCRMNEGKEERGSRRKERRQLERSE